MSRKSDMAAPAARAALRAAIMDAGLTAVLAFFLLLPLIGFRTVQNIRNEIVLETRWQMLFAFVAMAATGRLFYSLVIAPWRDRRATQARPPAGTFTPLRPTAARWRPAPRAGLTPSRPLRPLHPPAPDPGALVRALLYRLRAGLSGAVDRA